MRQEKTEGKPGGAEKPRGEKWSLGNEEKAAQRDKKGRPFLSFTSPPRTQSIVESGGGAEKEGK